MTDYANERQAHTHKLYAKCVHMNKFDEKYFQLFFYLGSSLCRNDRFFFVCTWGDYFCCLECMASI